MLVIGVNAQAAGPTGGGLKSGQQGTGKDKRLGGNGAMQKLQSEIFAKLNPPLSADQKQKLRTLSEKNKASLTSIREKYRSGDKEAMRNELKKIQDERKAAIESILTSEQRKSYQAQLKAALAKGKSERSKNNPKNRLTQS